MLSLLLILFFTLSAIITGSYRRYALSHHILDIPNARSAHHNPIPRGAGVVFVGLFIVAVVGLFPQNIPVFAWALGIAVLGYRDDKRPMSALYRIIFHILFSMGAVWMLGGMPDLIVAGWHIHFWGWTSIVAVIYLVSMLNLYNFMDGINGLAASEAICVVVGMAILYKLLHIPSIMALPLILAAVVAGFLVWNFPVAKVFMGDAGSGFLGITLGIFSLQAASIQPQLFWSWLILLGVFIVDSTFTLIKRMCKGEPLHIAHSSHAYQHAARHYGAHWPVTLGTVALNLLWLYPCAILVGLHIVPGWLGLIVAYIPIVILAGYFKAGCTAS